MSTMMSTEALWVVLDATGQIVLICGGADAEEVAAEWAKRGFEVQSIAAREVGVA